MLKHTIILIDPQKPFYRMFVQLTVSSPAAMQSANKWQNVIIKCSDELIIKDASDYK